MADEKATTQNPETKSSEAASDNPSLVGSDGLLNVDVIADENLREAAKSINSVVTEKLSDLSKREQEIAAMAADAKSYRDLASDPRAIKRLHDELFGETKTTPEPAKEPDVELSDDAIVDAPTIKKLAKDLSAKSGQSLAAATKQIKEELLKEVQAQYGPIADKVKASERNAKWAEVVARYPEAAKDDYRKEIAKVLGTKRVGSDDFEAAFLIVDATLSRKHAAEKKATDAVSKGRAATHAAQAAPVGKRMAANDVSSKGKGWEGAVRVAKEKMGASK